MVDMQSTPDSAVSPTYSGLHVFQTGRYDIDVPSISLDPFYYPACPSAPSVIAGSLGGPAQTTGGGNDAHTGGYLSAAARLHHGANKRLKYPAVVDDVGSISFSTRTDNHHHLSGPQSTQVWNSSAASHGI